MKQLGLLGKDISYSFSQNYFAQKFKEQGIDGAWTYRLFDFGEVAEIERIFDTPNLHGFNVTIPYKQEIITHLDELNETAEAVGAVNTVYIRNKKRIGYNTDVIGFRESLRPLLLKEDKAALVLGTGGASKAVVFALNELGIETQLVSRTESQNTLTYTDLDASVIKNHSIIINCTPIGTFPNTNDKPTIPYAGLNREHLLFDLVYNPTQTAFLEVGSKYGCRIKNGLEMLHLQAEAAWSIWNPN